jgi:hypothetical protein
VWKWNLKFSGEENVAEFITQVREYMQSRRVSERELLESASELFTGNALKWYRQVTFSHNLHSWEELVERLLIDFQGHDYNDELLDTIKNRKQQEHESIVIYVAIMEDMFLRLNNLPSERERIRILRKNLLPYYIHQTSLLSFNTVEEFKSRCKLLEAGKLQAEAAAAPKTSNRQTTTTIMTNNRYANNRNNTDRRDNHVECRPQSYQGNPTRTQPITNTYTRPSFTPTTNYQRPYQQRIYTSNNVNANNARQPTKSNQSNPTQNNITQCWLCRQNGHISRECPNRGNVIGAVEGSMSAPQMLHNGPVYGETNYQQPTPAIYYEETVTTNPNNRRSTTHPTAPTQQQPNIQNGSSYQQPIHHVQQTLIQSPQPQTQTQQNSNPTNQQILW